MILVVSMVVMLVSRLAHLTNVIVDKVPCLFVCLNPSLLPRLVLVMSMA